MPLLEGRPVLALGVALGRELAHGVEHPEPRLRVPSRVGAQERALVQGDETIASRPPSRSPSHTASIASSEALPSKTVSRPSSTCSGSSKASQDHSSVARNDRWRTGRSRGPPLRARAGAPAVRAAPAAAAPRAVGRELDRQRQAVQARADRIDECRSVVQFAVGPCRPSPRDEQGRGVLRCQRLHAVGVLGAQPQRRAAGREHGQVRDRGHQLTD